MDADTSTNQPPNQDDIEEALNSALDLKPYFRQEPSNSSVTENDNTPIENTAEEIKKENIENISTRKRMPRGTVPPALNLEEAVDIINAFYEDAGGEASFDALSQILGNSSQSSTFLKKMAALRNYGLVEGEQRLVKLSDKAYAIVEPRLPEDKYRALKQAFLNVDIFDKIYVKFMGRILPQDEFLVNSFKDYVPRELAQEWMDKFKQSALYADLFIERGDGKYQIREGVGGNTKTAEKGVEDSDKNEKDAKTPEDTNGQKTPKEEPPPYIPPPPVKQKTHYEFLIEILSPSMTDDEQGAVWTLIRYLKEQEAKNKAA